jgi:hypothetical protein
MGGTLRFISRDMEAGMVTHKIKVNAAFRRLRNPLNSPSAIRMQCTRGSEMPISTFFIQQSCDRCGGELGEERAISFFTGEVLCKYCSVNEEAIREKIRKQDEDPMADRKT